ncbi:MAG: hypothetical protein GY719_30445 [bacterium]|nr:hypothetical protein [bacterium]
MWNLHRLLLVSLYLGGLGVVAAFAVQGFDYYTTPLIERPRHELYWSFKPGGTHGLRFGIAGAAMMTLMLGYTLRKRWRPLRRLGPVRMWLDYHIFLGICGPLFILLHSSFKVGGLVSLSFWSMAAVALSGVLGRYLYRQIPRSRAGDELSLAEVEAQDGELSRQLVQSFGLPPEAVVELETAAESGLDPDRPLLWLLFTNQIDAFRMRRRLRYFSRSHAEVEPRLRRRFELAVARKARLRRRLLMWSRLRQIFHYWHVLHKPFAIIMYLFMVVHIGVAWMTGYV